MAVAGPLQRLDIGPALVITTNLSHGLPDLTPIVNVGGQVHASCILVRHTSDHFIS